jgi:hypothetical protein
MALQWLR